MLIMVASLALTGAAIFFGYFMAGALQKTKYAAVPINWIIENAGSLRVMIIAGILLFPIMFFLASIRLVRDLRSLNVGLQEIAAGRFGHAVTVKGKDELSLIAERMNRLSSEWDHDLAEMTRGLEEIAGGQFEHRIREIPNPKLGEVARSINRMSEQLKRSIAEERNAEKTKNDLITGVSHDLRTPLTSILGFLEVIEKDRYQDEVEMRYYINIAYEKSLALRRLIDELFEYTRINNGLPLELSELDVAGLLGQLAEEFVPITEKAGMEIRLHLPEEDFKIRADGGLLVRAYENIIANAIRHGKSSEFIDIEIGRDEEMLVVRIRNYGEPIPEGDLPFIFDRFYRGDRSRSKQSGGTGLGLAITKSIIEVHGGCITAHSSQKATWFETKLPFSGLKQAQETAAAESRSALPDNERAAERTAERMPEPFPESAPTAEPDPAAKRKRPPWRPRFFRSGLAAIPMIVLLVGAIVLVSVENVFTSDLMAKPNSVSPESGGTAPASASAASPIKLLTGKSDKEFTIFVHGYSFNEKQIIIRYSMKYDPPLIADQNPAKKSITPVVQLDDSTIREVPGIIAVDSGQKLYKNGVIIYSFGGTPPPEKFTLKVNIKSLLLVDELGKESTITGNWGFEMPVKRNYRLKPNGQSEPLELPGL
ncbi:sensor histidine kinase [Saccharibacillus alkalitolerans]|nr:ATP-binding protein [Saccharibacillus alkalitolerans]